MVPPAFRPSQDVQSITQTARALNRTQAAATARSGRIGIGRPRDMKNGRGLASPAMAARKGVNPATISPKWLPLDPVPQERTCRISAVRDEPTF
jgi:hypothetical protein